MTQNANWDLTDAESLFAEILERTPAERAALLDSACVDRPGLRAEVESLLTAHDEAADFLDTPAPHALAAELAVPGRLVGQRIGSFILEEQIGRGGMGVVYRAERRDGGFTQRVAVKIIDLSLSGPEIELRFRSERQILATLSHPHIVSLLDGGVTAEGRAYLVMEYVDGVPITTYCARERLSLPDRLTLVERVCDAVQHAHQHGVVHRDLKPANILVTADGVPKVLDFGIAKLWRAEPSDRAADTTDAGRSRLLTPNYASPEQLRGLPMTTASDLYALGVLLYELLAGAPPYQVAHASFEDMLRAVVEVDPKRPSAVTAPADSLPYARTRLSGDLDAVVLRAMRKLPSDRYASARELGEDLARSRTGQPVIAREPSFGYLLARIARRHRAALSAAVISVVALVGALGVSLWETRAARAESARATARFNDTRQLVEGLLFRLEPSVAALPGSTPVRRQIVDEALTYLERLSRDPAGDDALRLDLGRGYNRVADLQGNPGGANLGDRNGALKNFSRAIDLLKPLSEGPHASRVGMLELAHTYASLAMTVDMLDHHEDAIRAANAELAITSALVKRDPKDHDGRRALASAEFTLATVDSDNELPHWQAAGAVFESLLADDPANADSQRNVALVEKYIGAHYERQNDFAQALPHHLRAKALDETRLSTRPADRTTQSDVAIDLSNVAYALFRTGNAPEAAVNYERSLAMRQTLAQLDPKDVLARRRVAFVEDKLSLVYGTLGNYRIAVQHSHEAVKLAETLAGLDVFHRVEFAEFLNGLGVTEERAGDRPAACQAFTQSFDAVKPVKDEAGITPITREKVVALLDKLASSRRNCPASPGRPDSPRP